MVSLRWTRPGIPAFLEWWLRATSHFGCGHVEIAFLEEGDHVVVHGVRDLLAAHVARFGLGDRLLDLLPGEGLDEAALLAALSSLLARHGLRTSLAEPAACVHASVDEWLLRPARVGKVRRTLERHYVHLWDRLERRCGGRLSGGGQQGALPGRFGAVLALALPLASGVTPEEPCRLCPRPALRMRLARLQLDTPFRPVMRAALLALSAVTLLPVAAALAVLQPGGSGTLAQLTLPDGAEFLVTQSCNWSVEPYTVDFFLREAGGEWGWCYLDHEAFRWHDVELVHDAATDTLVVMESGKSRARLERRSGLFRLEGEVVAVQSPQALRSPGS